MITFRSRENQEKFINDLMNRLIHHRYAENIITVNTPGSNPYIYRHITAHDTFVMVEARESSVMIQLLISGNILLHRQLRLIQEDPFEVVALQFIDFCQKAEAIEKILITPQGE